ncbi:cryptochrome/photolyase family protein [Thiogranum longum]
MTTALVWLRRDLRLDDNPALQAALADGHLPVPVYIHDEPDGPWSLGSASAWWLHHSLCALQEALQQRGSDLLVLSGDSGTELLRLAQRLGADAVYWNRCYEPTLIERDQSLKRELKTQGMQVRSFNAGLLREPWDLLKKDGTPYRVFTPFWKALQASASFGAVSEGAQALPAVPAADDTGNTRIAELALLPRIAWHRAFPEHWQPGEGGAWHALQRFCDEGLVDYPEGRDRPELAGTSRLSPHLHFGEISPRQVWNTVHNWAASHPTPGAVKAAESFVRQLAWREFGHHLLYHFPATADAPLDERFASFPWRGDYGDDLRRWQRGKTGIPLVDAGMRELWTTGWMHNRVRMNAASLLTKNLLIPWQEGARWFWDTLVDADLANNTLGWQWTAGCGADAAPYFRIFNPVLQAQRFDPDGAYLRRWLPELADLPRKWIHQPWEAPPAELAAAGVRLDSTYPAPIVDLKGSRARALAVWDEIKTRA